MKKRIVSILLVCGLAVGCMAGCGQQKTPSDVSKESESKMEVVSSQEEKTEEASKHPITTEPITISVLTNRQQEATNDAKDLWNFKYLEYWMNQQGYNIKINPVQSTESTTITTMLQTDNLPDLIMGFPLDASQAVLYGAGEGMLMDWAPYINEEDMPNVSRLFENSDALVGCSYEGALYGLPYYSTRTAGEANFDRDSVNRFYLNKKWMDQLGIEDPTNIDEFIDMLRRFKAEIKLEDGQEVIPMVGLPGLTSGLWSFMGYYSLPSCYGYDPCIKNGELVLPALEDDFKTYVEVMHTLYSEGLVSPDFFTLDKTTNAGLMKSGVCGVMVWYSMENAPDFRDWKAMEPIAIGDTKEVVYSAKATYDYPRIWASSDFEYPEILAYMIDYIYSDEGAMYWRIGPMEGQDPLGLVDGWYFDENGKLTTKLVADGTYPSFESYCRQYIYAHDTVGNFGTYTNYAYELAGLDYELKTSTLTDAITGETIEADVKNLFSEDTAEGWWRISSVEADKDRMTTVVLPSMIFLPEDEVTRMWDLRSIIASHLTTGVVEFATGRRDLSEVEEFQQELIELGAEEYLGYQVKAYEDYMSFYFD